jgi:hypothetical protein
MHEHDKPAKKPRGKAAKKTAKTPGASRGKAPKKLRQKKTEPVETAQPIKSIDLSYVPEPRPRTDVKTVWLREVQEPINPRLIRITSPSRA